MEGRCIDLDQQRQTRRHSSGVLGWLYRYTRNIDIEHGSWVPFYLSSPLLMWRQTATLQCGNEATAAARDAECALLEVNQGDDDAWTIHCRCRSWRRLRRQGWRRMCVIAWAMATWSCCTRHTVTKYGLATGACTKLMPVCA